MELEPKTRCMESMSRDLPAGVLERVFTFLPIASVCRFRTLSKDWNRLISSPAFKHAGASEDYTLITPQCGKLEGGWAVLDVARKRYLRLSEAFLTKYVQRQGLDAGDVPSPQPFRTVLGASDGGLFCVWYVHSVHYSGLFVCNPVLRTVKQLPQAPEALWVYIANTVVMATNRSSMLYEVYIVNTAPFERESILVYESKTVPHRPTSYKIWWDSLTLFNNHLYLIVNRGDPSWDGLVSYDKETGVVSDIHGIDFLSASSRLVVSKARLFCVISMDVGINHLVEIFEVDFVKRASTRLTEMPQALVIWVLSQEFEYSLGKMEDVTRVVTASADCILIGSGAGRCAAYSLSNNSWFQIPDDRTIFEEYCRGKVRPSNERIHGSNNCLSLCAP